MVNVITSIVINKPVEVVSEYSADPDHAPVWYENIKSVSWVTEKPLREGSRVRFGARFMNRKLDYVYEIKEFKPGELLIMETAEGPFPMKTIYRWKEVDDGSTEMTLQNVGEPAGFSRFLSPLMSWMMRRANNKDLRKLKMVLERGG